jgi:hypothetical protein
LQQKVREGRCGTTTLPRPQPASPTPHPPPLPCTSHTCTSHTQVCHGVALRFNNGEVLGRCSSLQVPAIRGPTTVVPDRRTAQRPHVHEHHGRRTVALAEEARTTATSRAAATTRAGRMGKSRGTFLCGRAPDQSTAFHCQSLPISANHSHRHHLRLRGPSRSMYMCMQSTMAGVAAEQPLAAWSRLCCVSSSVQLPPKHIVAPHHSSLVHGTLALVAVLRGLVSLSLDPVAAVLQLASGSMVVVNA